MKPPQEKHSQGRSRTTTQDLSGLKQRFQQKYDHLYPSPFSSNPIEKAKENRKRFMYFNPVYPKCDHLNMPSTRNAPATGEETGSWLYTEGTADGRAGIGKAEPSQSLAFGHCSKRLPRGSACRSPPTGQGARASRTC